MKKRNIIIIVAVVLVAAVVLFFVFSKSSKEKYNLDTISLATTNINIMVTATGTVEPITKVDVGTQVSGIIDKIYVDYNSEVTKGQLLAELDKVTLQSDLKSKQMELKTAQVEYEYQKKNFDRTKDLYQKELISQTDYETAQYTYEKAESTYRRLESDLIKVKTNLNYATIHSPIDGVVLSKAVEEGQTVAASFNTPTLFTIANDLTKMQVVANVDEADIGEVAVGQKVTFTVDAYPSDVFEGSISQVRLEAIVTSNVVTYEVIVNAPNPDLKLKPGLTANITIYTLEKKGVNTLPNKVFSFYPDEAMLKDMGYDIQTADVAVGRSSAERKIVWILNGTTIRPESVSTGATDGVNTEVLSGIGNSDAVVSGVSMATKKKNNGGEASPFMPQRGGGRR